MSASATQMAVIRSNFGSRDGRMYQKSNKSYGEAIGSTDFFPLAWIPLLWRDSLHAMIDSGEVHIAETPSRIPGFRPVTLLVKGAAK